MAPQTDHDKFLSLLMHKAQMGDKEAYDRLLRETVELMRGFVQRRIGSGTDSEDVLQEILISLHNARHTYDPHRSFIPWIFAIARFRICDYWRKASRRLNAEAEEEADLLPAPSAPQEESGLLSDRLAKSLSRLPKKQAMVINLLKMKGLSIREAAQELKMSEAALKVTAHRAYAALRREFEVETDGYA